MWVVLKFVKHLKFRFLNPKRHSRSNRCKYSEAHSTIQENLTWEKYGGTIAEGDPLHRQEDAEQQHPAHNSCKRFADLTIIRLRILYAQTKLLCHCIRRWFCTYCVGPITLQLDNNNFSIYNKLKTFRGKTTFLKNSHFLMPIC